MATVEPEVQGLEESFSDWVIHEGAPETPPEVPASAAPPGPGPLRMELALERGAATLEAGELQAVLSAVAPSVDGAARAPLHLVAVLDKSGSMHGEKLRLVRETMLFMLRHLSDRDALGLVEYGTEVKVAAPLTYCDADGRALLEAALRRLQAGSQTNLSGGLLKGLGLHRSGARWAVAPAQAQAPLQRLRFGNTYRRLTEEEAQARTSFGNGPEPEGAQRVHEWTMELRFEAPEEEALVQSVVYRLHPTFAEPVVEVSEPPFCLSRHGWGTFPVSAELRLRDGRVLALQHELCFEQPETFRTILLPLRAPPVAPSPPAGACSGDAPAGAEGAAVVRSTFLFTDGLANVGISKTEDLCAAAEAVLGELGCQRCSLSTFGFGKDHNADLLQGLAEAGSGIYSYVEGEDKIGDAFGEALGGLLSTTHQNVTLSLELAPGVGLAQALTSYPVTVREEPRLPGQDLEAGCGTRVEVDLGDLFAEERRDVLVALALPAAAAEGPLALGRLRVGGFSLLARRSEEAAPLALAVERQSGAAGASCHPQVARHRNRHVATGALEAGRAAAQQRDFARARRLLTEASEAISASPLTAQGDPASLGLLTDLNECLRDLQQESDYRAYGSKKMNCMLGAHSKQRACYGQDFSDMYANQGMQTMKKAFKNSIG